MTATGRLYGVFEAELLDEAHIQSDDLDLALKIKGASFTWDSSPPEVEERTKGSGKGAKGNAAEKAWTRHEAENDTRKAAATKVKREDERVFKVRDVDMEVGRGQLVAIVGAVGSGKTSLLQGIIGEMRKTAGEVHFGGSVGYCPQSAWIQVGRL